MGRLRLNRLFSATGLVLGWLLALGWIDPAPLGQDRPQQEPGDPTIAVDVNLVTVRVTARSSSGSLVNHLGKDAFVVRENGQIQETVFFEAPRNQNQPEEQALWLAFLLDVSGSTFSTRAEEIIAAQVFLDNISQFAQLGIYGFTDVLIPFQPFTPSREAALKAFGQAREHLGKTSVYGSLESLIQAMSSQAQPGDKKVIIVVSDGQDEAYPRFRRTVALAKAHSVVLYTIQVPSATQIYISPASSKESPTLSESAMGAARAFAQISSLTGGKHFSGFEAVLDLDQTLARISDDIFGNLYTLGYYTEDPFLTAAQRQIRITTSQPNVTLSLPFAALPPEQDIRKNFIASLLRDDPFRSLQQFPDLRIFEIGADLDLLPPRRESKQLSLPFRLKISPSVFRTRAPKNRTQFGIIGLVLDQQGAPVVRFREIFRASFVRRGSRQADSVIYTNRLFLEPGAYQLKMALFEIPSWRITSFQEQITVQ